MRITSEHVNAPPFSSAADRLKYIAAQEKSWMQLAWDRQRYSQDVAKSAIALLSAIAFSDHTEPIDSALLPPDESPGSSSRAATPPADASPGGAPSGASAGSAATADAASCERGTKRRAETPPGAGGAGAATQNHGNNGNNGSSGGSAAGGGAASSGAKPPAKKAKTSGKKQSILATGTQVACFDPSTCELWMLGRICRYLGDVKKYEIVDDDDELMLYRVPRRNIRVIPKRPPQLDPKKRVFAVYPTTTVFYTAKLVARRGYKWMVEFDDEDENETLKEVDARLILQE